MSRKIKIICIGKVKERYLQEGINEFLKRLKPFCDVEIIELKDRGVIEDSKFVQKYVDHTSFILDVNGKSFSSEEFAELIKKTETTLTLIIGGAEGFNQDIKKNAKLLSLSKMTFTHEMTRLFLVEQIYRSFMIINNKTYYHK